MSLRYTTTVVTTMCCMLLLGLGAVAFNAAAFEQAVATSYTEDFSTSTYFNSDAGSTFITWVGGARAIYDTNHAVPSPYIYRHSGGTIKNSALVGDYVYTANYGTTTSAILHYFNTNTNTFSVLDLSSSVDATINEMYADATNNNLYITWGNSSIGGVTTVDVSNPASPAVEATTTGIPNAQYIAVDEATAQMYVVSNGATPKLTSFLIDEGEPLFADDITLTSGVTYYHVTKHPSTDIVFIAGSTAANALTAINVNDPYDLTQSTFSGDSFGMNTITDTRMVGNHMFAVGKNTSNQPVAKIFRIYTGLQVLDVSEYAFASTLTPQYLEQGVTTALNAVFYTYSAAGTYRQVDAFTVNTLTPEFDDSPIDAEGSTRVGSTWASEMVFAEDTPNAVTNTLYLAHNQLGLIAIDVSDDDALGTPLETLSVGGGAVDVIISASSAYVANAGSQTIQNVFFADTPASMSVIETASTATCGEPTRLAHYFDWDWLVTACGTYYITNDLRSGLTSPTFVNTGDTVNDLAVAFDNAYLAHNAGLTVYSLATGTQVGSTIGSVGTPTAIAISGNTLLITSDTGIHVFDISSPNAPTLTRSYNPAGTQVDVDIDGEYAFIVGNQLEAILLSELTDPTNTEPTVQSLNTQSAQRIEVDDGYAHLGANGQSADEYQLVNVRNPESMTAVTVSEDLQNGNLGGGIAVMDGWVLQADGADLIAAHMDLAYVNTIESEIVDSVSTQITSVDYTFSQIANGGQARYYISNNNGANWYYVGLTSTDTDVTGTYTFTTTGSQLRWKTVLYPDTDTYAVSPVVTGVTLEYTSNTSFVEDTTGPSVIAFPDGGSYSGPQTVTFTASEANSTILYTTDGSTPDINSAVYFADNPLEVTTTTTVKAIAIDASNNAGSVLTEVYTIGSTPDTEAPSSQVEPGSFTASDGPFSAPFSVGLVCEDAVDFNATIRYTTDGTEPDSTSTLYMNPIAIVDDTVLTFRCTDAAGNVESPANTEAYVFTTVVTDTTAPTSSINPPAGTYPSGTSISMTAADDYDSAPTIYYTTDGSTPSTTNGFIYTTPITIFIDTTIKFFAIDASANAESVHTAAFIIGGVDDELEETPTPEDPALDPVYVPDTEAPIVKANPSGGTFETPQTVRLTCTDVLDPNPTIYYTLGSTVSSRVYTEPIPATENMTIRAECVDASGNRSATIEESYVITNTVTDTTAPASVNTCPEDGYFGELEIRLTAEDDNDESPSIYYTLDGSAPLRLAAFTYLRTILLSDRATIRYFSRDASGNEEETQTVQCKVYDPDRLTLVAKNKKKGKGLVRIVNKKNKKTLKTFKAFNKGGVRAAIVLVNGEKRVGAMQYKKANLLKLFDLNGNLLGKKKFAAQKQRSMLAAGNLYTTKTDGEIIVTQLNTTTGELTVRAFSITSRAFSVTSGNKLKLLATATVQTDLRDYRLQIKKKKLFVKTTKGKTQLIMRLVKDGKNFQLEVQ